MCYRLLCLSKGHRGGHGNGITKVDIPRSVGRKTPPPWLPMVCRQREWFATAAIRIGAPEDCSIWRLAFASQSPYLACMVRLRPVDALDDALTTCRREGIIASDWERSFVLDLSDWVWTDDGPFDLQAPFAALPGLVYAGEDRFVADGGWLEIAELRCMFVDTSPEEQGEEEETVGQPEPEHEPSVFEKNPWLLDYLHENPWMEPDNEAHIQEEAPFADKKEMRTTEAETEHIFEILMSKRAEWQPDDMAERSHFSVDLLGGRWTKAHLGVEYDAFRGSCQRGEAEQWCDRYSLQKSFRCGLRQVSEEVAHLICTEWCKKMQWLFDKWLAEGDGVDYGDEALSAFPESLEVSKVWEAGAGGPARERIGKIRSLRPRAVA